MPVMLTCDDYGQPCEMQTMQLCYFCGGAYCEGCRPSHDCEGDPEGPLRETELIICHGCADPHECQAMKDCDDCGWSYCEACWPTHDCHGDPEGTLREAELEGDNGGE